MTKMCETSGAPNAGGPQPDRRKELRAAMDAPVWLRVLADQSPAIEGRIANVSRRGMKLRLPQALAPGTMVQLRIGGKIIMAEVRYCLARGAEFHLGVEIQDVFPIPGHSGASPT